MGHPSRGDPAESPLSRVDFQYPEDPEDAPEKEGRKHHQDVLEFARRLVSYIRSKPRARLTVDCLYIALGDAALEGISMSKVAKKYGITKAAVSKRVREIREDLKLPRTGYNKSEHAVKTYRNNPSQIRIRD